MKARTKERKNERTKEQKNKRTKEQKNERTKERKNERTKERKNERKIGDIASLERRRKLITVCFPPEERNILQDLQKGQEKK